MGVLPLKVLVAKLFKMIPKPLWKFIMIDFKLLSKSGNTNLPTRMVKEELHLDNKHVDETTPLYIINIKIKPFLINFYL